MRGLATMPRGLDDFLVDRVAQPLADRLAGRAAPDALGRSLVLGGAVFWCCSAMARFVAGELGVFSAVATGIGVSGTLVMLAATPGAPKQGAMPAARATLLPWRLVVAVMAALCMPFWLLVGAAGRLEGSDLLWMAQVQLTLWGLCLMACRNPPPRRRQAADDRAATAPAATERAMPAAGPFR